jgi:hypothetical protein
MKRRIPALAAIAAMLLGLFAVVHALGFRDDVSVLSGTPTSGDPIASALSGVAYAAAWFLAVVVAPVLALAALFQAVLAALAGRRAPPS